MGLFSRKTEVYARNTLIAELETKIESLNAKIEKLKNENADLRASLSNLKATNEALLVENQAFSYNLKKARAESVLIENQAETAADGDSLEDKKKVRKLEQLASEKYALELKRLNFFSKKWQAYFSLGKITEKQELIILLNKILAVNDIELISQARLKTDEILKFIGEPFNPEKLIKEHFEKEDYIFDLDEVINPKTPLSLEELCKDLGVFEG